MIILDNLISREELSHWAECIYGDMIKGVVDVNLALLAGMLSNSEGWLILEDLAEANNRHARKYLNQNR